MNQNLKRWAEDLAEDFVIFTAESGYHLDEYVMRPEAYIKGRINNMTEKLIAYTIEVINESTGSEF